MDLYEQPKFGTIKGPTKDKDQVPIPRLHFSHEKGILVLFAFYTYNF